jgi:hypothetical protein
VIEDDIRLYPCHEEDDVPGIRPRSKDTIDLHEHARPEQQPERDHVRPRRLDRRL